MNEYLTAVVSVIVILATNLKWLNDLKKDLRKDNEKIYKTLNDINMRLTRLEAKFEERGRWESRIVQFTAEPKKKKVKGE